MKTEEIKRLYQVTSRFHERVADTLNQLDDASFMRYRRKRTVKQLAVAFAVIVLLATFSSAAYATNLFGLLTEPVGKYGLNMQIVGATPDSSEDKKRVKPNPRYLPQGFRQIVDKTDLRTLTEGVTVYDPNGIYIYSDGSADDIRFFVFDENDFQVEGTYIVDYSEEWYNGHKTVFYTRQFQTNGEKYYNAIEYFEDWGYAVVCECGNSRELKAIMKDLELQEAEDYTEPMTIDTDDDLTSNYAYSIETERVQRQFGKAFIWTQQTYYSKHNEYEITVKDIQENNGMKGLDREKLISQDDEWYARYFNYDGSLKTPYTRTNFGEGDGINTIGRMDKEEVERHFYLVTVEIKAFGGTTERFTGQFTTDGYGGVIYQDLQDRNKTDTVTLGIIADEDELDQLALNLHSMEIITDDIAKTVVRRDIDTVIPLSVGQ